jgi:2-C-methyl-D-erythritol 2,4-cyclodiphosphate synthase
MKERGYTIGNLDATVELEKPKLREHIDAIVDGLSRVLETATDRVSVKAKTGEGVDAVGERRAVRATAVVLLVKSE